jgi:hypothetical protein
VNGGHGVSITEVGCLTCAILGEGALRQRLVQAVGAEAIHTQKHARGGVVSAEPRSDVLLWGVLLDRWRASVEVVHIPPRAVGARHPLALRLLVAVVQAVAASRSRLAYAHLACPGEVSPSIS